MLKYAHGEGCPWDSNVCFIAAVRGDLPVLQYAHEQGCVPVGQRRVHDSSNESRATCRFCSI